MIGVALNRRQGSLEALSATQTNKGGSVRLRREGPVEIESDSGTQPREYMSRKPEGVLGRSKREREEEETSRKWNGGLCVGPRAEDTDTVESIGSSRRGYLLNSSQ
jgi:hypothetical protein